MNLSNNIAKIEKKIAQAQKLSARYAAQAQKLKARLQSVAKLLGAKGASLKSPIGAKRKLSPAGRKAIAAAQRKRWAKVRSGRKP